MPKQLSRVFWYVWSLLWSDFVLYMFHCCYVGMWIIWFNNEQAMGVYGCRSKVEVCFYIAQYPVSWTAQSAFHFSSPGRPVHSDTNPASLGSILAMQQLRNDYSLTCPPLSIARYHFFYSWVDWGIVKRTKMPKLRNGSKGGFQPGSLGWESGILPLTELPCSTKGW